MGAGFGHTFTTDHPHEQGSFPALAFMFNDMEPEDLSELDFDDLYSDLTSIESVEITLKGRTFQVDVHVESTYYGDDYCIVPRDSIWGAYSDAVWDKRTFDPDISNTNIDWDKVAHAVSASHLCALFNQAVLKEVMQMCPYLKTRERICGWLGTSYVPLADMLNQYLH